MLVKKYGNRRLYDTERSRYVRLGEITDRIRAGADVRVIDAKTNVDLTAPTLAQIIFEDRDAARLLPVPLLLQLIRMRDDALAEFLGRYVSWALEMYVQARQGAGSLFPFSPFLSSPFSQAPSPPSPPPERPVASAPAETRPDEVAALRRELDALKKSLRKRRR